MDHVPPLPSGSGDIGSETRAKQQKKPWLAPKVIELPSLTDLTLQTGAPIDGSGITGGGGSTVF